MRRNRFRIQIRVWLALAIGIASLGLVSSASAQLIPSDGGTPLVTSEPAVVITTPNDGFNWGDALAGAGVGLAVAAGATGVVYGARRLRRTRLVTEI